MNDTYRWKVAAVREAWAAEDYKEYVFLHEKPCRATALMEVAPLLHGSSYWQLVSDTWVSCENIWQCRRAWRKLWCSKEPDREAAMNCDDRQYLASLPDVLTVCRGIQLRAAMHGLSWTFAARTGGMVRIMALA